MRIVQVTSDQFLSLLGEVPDPVSIRVAANLSADILCGMLDSTPLCFLGFAPTTLISDSAYVWMIETELGKQHSIRIARCSREVVARALNKYPVLFGHCFNSKSAAWLRWLGAEFISPTQFEIRRG